MGGADDEFAVAETMSSDVAIASAQTMESGEQHGNARTVASEVPRSEVGDGAQLIEVDRDHYEMLSEFGRGALGKIIRARDRRTGRIVAIKEMLAPASTVEARFAREAVITANLQHPGIVPVYEVGCWADGKPFYAMKLVDGRPLEDAMVEASSMEQRVQLLPHVRDIADALAYAHDQGVIHRDLKPANVLIGAFGETVVIDWGLAKRRDESDGPRCEGASAVSSGDATLTLDGDVMGTPAYMSPEQASGSAVDERTDVYAIGAILYQLLSGTTPFAEVRSVGALLLAVQDRSPVPLAEIAPGAPADLLAIAAKAMARDPSARYSCGAELAKDLRRFETGQMVGAREYSVGLIVGRWIRRHRMTVSVAAVLVAALVFGGAVAVGRILQEQRAAHTAMVAARNNLASTYKQMAVRQLERRWPLRAMSYVSESAVLGGALDSTTRLIAGLATASLDRLERVVRGDEEPVVGVAFSGSGKNLTVVTDGEFRLYDTENWTRTNTIKAEGKVRDAVYLPGGELVTIANNAVLHGGGGARVIATAALSGLVSPDGMELVLGKRDGSVSIRNVANPAAETFSWKASDGPIWRMAASPVAAVLATDSDDVVLWNPHTGVELARFVGAAFPSFSPGGELLVMVSDFGHGSEVVVGQVEGGAELHRLGHADEVVTSAMFSADGTAVITAAGEYVRWWDALTGELLHRRNVGAGVWVAAVTDGIGCVIANGGGRIERITPDSSIAFHATGSGITSVAINPATGVMMSSSEDGNLYVWKASRDANTIGPPAGSETVSEFTFGPNAQFTVVTSTDGRAELRREGVRVAGDSAVQHVSFSEDGMWVALGHVDGSVEVRATKTPSSSTQVVPPGRQAAIVRLFSRGTHVAIVDVDNRIGVWDVKSGIRVVDANMAETVGCLEPSPDGRWVVACVAGPSSAVFSLPSGEQRVLETGHLWTHTAAFSPTANTLIVGGGLSKRGHGAVLLYDMSVTPPARRLVAVDGVEVSGAVFSPDGQRLAVGFEDRIEVWDGDGEHRSATLQMSGRELSAMAFGSGNALLSGVFGSGDVSVWDIASGLEAVHESWGRDSTLVLRPDGRGVVVRDEERTFTWEVPHFDGGLEDLVGLAACFSRWRIRGGALVLGQCDLSRCPQIFASAPVSE